MFFLHFTRLPQAILSCHHSCCVACYVMDKRGGEEPLTFLQQCDNIDLVWIEIKKMNLVVKQWTNIHKPFYDFLKNAAYFFSFKLIKFNKRKIAKIEIGCYVMNWREEPLTFPQECSNMCLAHFKCTSVHFKFLKTTTLPPKYLESDSMAIVFLGHYQDAVSLLLSIQHTIIHLNNWTLLFIFISFLISHVTNPLHLRGRSVLFVSKKGNDLTHQHPLWSCLKSKEIALMANRKVSFCRVREWKPI